MYFPHQQSFSLFVCSLIITITLPQQGAGKRRPPTGGPIAVVVDERLAALRVAPDPTALLMQRLSKGRLVAIKKQKRSGDAVFLLVKLSARTSGWLQRESVVAAHLPGEDERLFQLLIASTDFEQIQRARIFLDFFPRSKFRPAVLLLIGDSAELLAGRLSRDAARRLQSEAKVVGASRASYFLNYSGLDRFNRQRIRFVFDSTTESFHYDGAAWRELLRKYPRSAEAHEARKRIERISGHG